MAVAVVATYANSFPGDFHFDDFALLIDNPRVTGESFRYISFLDHYGGRPLTLLLLHFSYGVFGGEPLGYHVVSLLLHLLVSVGILLFVLQQTGRSGLALATALVFAAHPLQTQAVNYIWSQSMLLMSFWSVTALLLIRRSPRWSLVAAQMAIWSRFDAVVLIPFLVLLDRRRWKSLSLLGSANIVVFVTALSFYAPDEVGWNHSDKLGFFQAQPQVLIEYLGLMLWPVDLHIDRAFVPWSSLLSIVGLLGIVVASWLVVRSRAVLPEVAFGFVWIVAWLAPSSILPNSDLVNESRSYLALAGSGFLIVLGADQAIRKVCGQRVRLAAVAAVAVLAVVLFLPSTLQRNSLWTDDVALYEDAASKSPEKARIRYNLGSALARSGRISEAEIQFRKALLLGAGDDLTYEALGYCAEMQADHSTATQHYREALEINPKNKRAVEGLSRIAPGMAGTW